MGEIECRRCELGWPIVERFGLKPWQPYDTTIFHQGPNDERGNKMLYECPVKMRELRIQLEAALAERYD